MRKLYLFLAWLSLSVVSYTQTLVAYYPFNGNANDQSGNNINPTYTGAGVTLTTDRFGNTNKAYQFDGASGSYMRMPSDLLPTTNRTISLWFNAASTSIRPVMLGYGGQADLGYGTSFLMGLNISGCGCYHTQAHYYTNQVSYNYSTDPVNQWIHWVVTINGNTTKMYVNGTLVANVPGSFTSNTYVPGRDFSIGVPVNVSGVAPYTDVNGGYFQGKLDDIRIYDAAMTDAQVLQLYNNESYGLVAYYPFNGNANDESGNGRNGTVMNGATLTTDRFGNAGSAYSFDGINDYIDASATGLPTNNRTVSFWLNPATGNQPSYPLSYGGSGSANSFLMAFNANGCGCFSTQGHYGVNALDYTWVTNPENKWVHYVVTINGTAIKMYINGVPVAGNNSFTNATYVDGRKLIIGGLLEPAGLLPYIDPSGGYFKGMLDDVRIYDAAMTDAQVLQLYQSESVGPVAYYRFNGNANDQSGNGNHGTLMNGATFGNDQFNIPNMALQLSQASSQYVNVPNSSSIQVSDHLSISVWVKRNSLTTIDEVLNKGGEWNSGTCNYGLVFTPGELIFKYNGGYHLIHAPQDFKWHHYVITTYHGSPDVKFYIDGIYTPTWIPQGPINLAGVSTSDLEIGRMATTYYSNNSVDELRIYKRVLSPAEILQQYKNESSGLVAYYPFNGNANDESGNGNNGTVIGATLTTDRFGNANKAYSFTNPNHIEVPNSNMLGDEFTVSYWFKIGSYFGQRAAMSNVAGPNGGFQQQSDGTSFSYILGYSFIGGYSPNYFYANYTMQEALDQWHHLAVTYKKLGTYSSETRLYIDGDLKRTDAHVMPITFTPDAIFHIGQNHGGVNFQGDLDDIRIYNRNLSPNEIAKLADKPMMPDLIAYLPMNGDANDKSGNNRNGSPYGGAALTTDKYGNNNSAYYFTNPECGISLANTTALDFTGQPFAISAWVKYNNIPAADFAVVSKHNCGTPNGYLLGINNNSPRFYLCTGGSWSIISTTETYNDNKWHHLVATYDGTGSQQLYVDGELKASASSVVFNTPGSGAPIIVGDANGNCGGGIFSASIDEVKIYGAALDAAQVTALYKQSRGSGNAIRMQGNGYFDIGNLGAPHFFTVEAWIKRINASATQYVLSGNGANSWSFGVTTSRLFVSLNGASTVTSQDVPEINDGKWHHVAVAFQDGPMNFYVDGVHKGWTEIGTSGLSASNYSIGTQFSPGNSLDGEIDEIRIWDWVLDAENADTIRSWMNRKITPAHPVYSSLIRYYTFNEPNLDKAYDMAASSTGLLVNNIGGVLSGAAIGDASVYDFINQSPAFTVPGGESFNADASGGSPEGISVYLVKDPPLNQAGILGLGGNDHYFGVQVSGGTNPTYTAEYFYEGSSFVTPATEPTLKLFRRDNNSVIIWADCGAILNTTLNTLTATGQHTEYVLGSSGYGLPVTMLSFEAKKINTTTVQLNWKTATEINNKGFEVQRSFDGNYFTVISFVNSEGNSDVLKEYRITDVPGRTGRVYYRLRQVDVDGNSKLSPIASVVFDQQSMVKLYPNPAQHHVTIEGVDSYQRIQLLDVSGKMVKEQVLNGQTTIIMNLEGLRSGLYLMHLMNAKENLTIKLLIGN